MKDSPGMVVLVVSESLALVATVADSLENYMDNVCDFMANFLSLSH